MPPPPIQGINGSGNSFPTDQPHPGQFNFFFNPGGGVGNNGSGGRMPPPPIQGIGGPPGGQAPGTPGLLGPPIPAPNPGFGNPFQGTSGGLMTGGLQGIPGGSPGPTPAGGLPLTGGQPQQQPPQQIPPNLPGWAGYLQWLNLMQGKFGRGPQMGGF